MKLTRLALVCTLLLLAATPSFALPCRSCTGTEYPYCEDTPGSGTRCRIGVDWCETITASSCSPLANDDASPALADWTVASIEVSCPNPQLANVATAPAPAAETPTHAAGK